MDPNSIVQQSGLKWRCREHPTIPCDFICLDGNSKERVVCFLCVQKQSIPFSNLISISCVLAVKEQDFLEAYPPLKDQELSDRLGNVNLQQHIEEIVNYFKRLKQDIEKEVQAAQQRAKQSLIKLERAHQKLFEGYLRIAEVDKLKQLIVSEKESAEKDLDDFIKEKWNKAEENRKVIANLINQVKADQQVWSDEPNIIAQETIQSLKNLNFFLQSNQKTQVTLITSTINNPPQMVITKLNNSVYQVKKETYNRFYDQVFIDPIINPLKKYILHIELVNGGATRNHFLFGLVKDEGKDNGYAYGQNMSYYDASGKIYGINKYIKGSPLQSGSKMTKHSLEVRIHLDQKFLRVASLPDYSSIVELDDPNKIDPKVAYRFFLAMKYQGDMMRITQMRTVREFDENM